MANGDLPLCPICRTLMEFHCPKRRLGWCGWFRCAACGVNALRGLPGGGTRYIAQRRDPPPLASSPT